MAAGRARVGLVKCGGVRPDLVADHGDYPELFARLFASEPLDLVTYHADHGEVPTSPADCDAWLISGSTASVYEPLDWIDRTRTFVATVVEAGTPLVGICFGHQLLAEALGGEVARSARGWGVGVHTYDVVAPLPRWPADVPPPARLSLLASHQDQVIQLPPGTTLLATSDHCPVAAFSANDRTVAVQAHPEFTPRLTAALVEGRRSIIGEDRADDALDTIDHPLDAPAVARWLGAVLTS